MTAMKDVTGPPLLGHLHGEHPQNSSHLAHMSTHNTNAFFHLFGGRQRSRAAPSGNQVNQVLNQPTSSSNTLLQGSCSVTLSGRTFTTLQPQSPLPTLLSPEVIEIEWRLRLRRQLLSIKQVCQHWNHVLHLSNVHLIITVQHVLPCRHPVLFHLQDLQKDALFCHNTPKALIPGLAHASSAWHALLRLLSIYTSPFSSPSLAESHWCSSSSYSTL